MALEMLASGYGLLEGPRVDEQNRLYFSDVPNGGVYRRNPDGKIETLVPKRKGVGGIALNEGGGLVISGRTLCYWNEATGQSRDIFTQWEGRTLKG
ncbi:MAG: SMP-30/gluconolactonase/LRE family protein, partial [Candidatus Binataceae bacterium]